MLRVNQENDARLVYILQRNNNLTIINFRLVSMFIYNDNVCTMFPLASSIIFLPNANK